MFDNCAQYCRRRDGVPRNKPPPLEDEVSEEDNLEDDWTLQDLKDRSADHDVNRKLVAATWCYCVNHSKPRPATFKEMLTLAHESCFLSRNLATERTRLSGLDKEASSYAERCHKAEKNEEFMQETLKVKTTEAAAALRAVQNVPDKVEDAKHEGELSDFDARKALDESNATDSALETLVVDVRARLARKTDIFAQIRLEKKTEAETRDRHVSEGNHLRQKVAKLQTELVALRAKPDCAAERSVGRAELKLSEESRVALAGERDEFREALTALQGRHSDLMRRKNRVSFELVAEITRGDQLKDCIKSVSASLAAGRKVPEKCYTVFQTELDREMAKDRTWSFERGTRVHECDVKVLEDRIKQLTDGLASGAPPPEDESDDGDQASAS